MKKKILKETIKLKILQAALKLIEKSGWEGMSVRKLSEKINYSTIKIYSEFGGKEGLLAELKKTEFESLKSYLDKRVLSSDTPAEKLKNISLALWDFVDNKPYFFQLMVGLNGAPIVEKKDKNSFEVGQYLREQVQDAIPLENWSLWYNWCALVQGHLLIDSQGFLKKEQSRTLFEDSLNRFIIGLE